MRPYKIFLIAGLLFGNGLFAQQTIRLNNNWEFIKKDLGTVYEAVRPILIKDGPENYPIWEKVNLPHCFNARDAVDPDGNYYQGPGWYRTKLEINNPYKNGHTILHFEGAGQKTDVYVYTTKVGGHVGGYDEWFVDITQAVEDFKKTTVYAKQFKGKIPVEIRCDNSRDAQTIPSQLSDFNVYGGLYRYLNMVYQPNLVMDNLYASATLAKDYKTGSIDIKADFYNPENLQQTEGNIKILDAAGKTVAENNYTVTGLDVKGKAFPLCNFSLTSPHLWSPGNPYLYTVQVTVGDYKRTEKIGFRDFLFSDAGPFLLNGQRLLLRGTHRHEDEAGVAEAMTESQMMQEMQMIKDMGANFIRLGHYQQSRTILNLCDSLGLLVWEEEPWCRGGVGGDAYKEEGRRMLTNMIHQHYNHASIILWGLGNENDWESDFVDFDKQKIRDFMSAQNDLAHQLDPSRKTTIRRCDFCKDIPDVYSPSIWSGWYSGSYTQYKTVTEREFKKVKHPIHAEWGGDSYSGRNSELADKALENIRVNGVIDTALFNKSAKSLKDGDWSENATCNLYDWTLKEQETMPWLSGTAFWTFKDFSTPIRFDNPLPYVNQKGVVERDMTKKEIYYLVQSYWAEKPMAHIYGHNWPVRWGDDGEARMVKAYSNCDEAELFVNGKSYGVKKRDSQNFPAAGLRWMVQFAKGKNELLLKAHKGNITITDTISQQYQTEKWGKPAKMNLTKIAEKDGTTTLQATLVDSKGVLCLDAVNWVDFSLSGDGTLLDDLGTSKGSRKLQVINGRAVISVKTNKGKSVVGVQSQGIQTVFINI